MAAAFDERYPHAGRAGPLGIREEVPMKQNQKRNRMRLRIALMIAILLTACVFPGAAFA